MKLARATANIVKRIRRSRRQTDLIGISPLVAIAVAVAGVVYAPTSVDRRVSIMMVISSQNATVSLVTAFTISIGQTLNALTSAVSAGHTTGKRNSAVAHGGCCRSRRIRKEN
jgi:hypothetical protein